jgi:hypothetical protein
VRVAHLIIVPLVGCSTLLGIQDPVGDGSGTGSMRPDAGNGSDDGGTEPTVDHLTFSAGNTVTLMSAQHMRFRVMLVHNGVPTDATVMSGFSLTTDAAGTVATLVTKDAAGAETFDTVASGLVHITAKLTGVTPAVDSIMMTVNITDATCHPVINEVATGTTARGASDEYAEIYNPCTVAFDVSSWTLKYRGSGANGPGVTGDTNTLTTFGSGDSMPPGDIRLYAGSGYAGTVAAKATFPTGTGLGSAGGAVGLRDEADVLVDSMAYVGATTSNPFDETNPVANIPINSSAMRGPFDGNDSNNNVGDFVLSATPTPGTLNQP